MTIPRQQLLLVKYLYQKGEDALEEGGPFSSGLAVSLFQDAAETMMALAAKEVGARMSPKVPFDGYWELIERASAANGKQLPPNGPMLQLNAAIRLLQRGRVAG